ncbi:phage terminase large subunit [Streptomyces sp. NRRL F-5123]|uniref:phage terminase large subunit n=1 Tax=Streptomyces sp. NRRL F-5123 TaxID=1463856 RepID=UPI0005BD3A55|nr:phage terminase large subunit [Streptomyces sp. NRRL F-5123]
MTATVVRYEPRGAALDMFRSKANEILMSGAAGTGKSVGALMKVHLACLHTPKVRALIVRKTHASLTASTLVTFRQKVAAEAIAAQVVKFYGGSAQEPAAFRYSNGSAIVVGGLDRATRLLSTEYDLCFVDEAIETTAEDLDTIVTRLRNGRLSYQQLIMATNPGPPTHHLKQRANAGRCQMLYSRHEDNPRLYHDGEWTEYGRAYLERLDSLTGARKDRMRFGKWVAAEGLVYEAWDPAVHLVDPFEVPKDWTRWWSVDLGYVNPTVIQFWAEDPDGRLFLYREMYRTKTLVEDHARAVLRTVQRCVSHCRANKTSSHNCFTCEACVTEWTEPRPRAVITDHDAEDRATLERHLKLSTTAAHKGVSDGIQAVQARLKPAGDGRPRLFIMRGALVARDPELDAAKKPCSTEDEITGYVWDRGTAAQQAGEKPAKDAPLKLNDHGMDAMRYVVAERDLGGRPRIRRL